MTALASKKDYPVFVDASALQHSIIAVSAGVRETQMVLSPQGYVRATAATFGPIAGAILTGGA